MGKRIILFGAGDAGKSALGFFGHDEVEYFVDNFKEGEIIEGKKVVSFAYLKEHYNGELVVITPESARMVYEMCTQLNGTNISYSIFDLAGEGTVREEAKEYDRLNTRNTFAYDKDFEYIIVRDRYSKAGHLSSYFIQDLWAAKHIHQIKPNMHYDIGSRVDGFIAHLLSFEQKVTQFDIRPLKSEMEGWDFIQEDATELSGIQDESIESLSALCSLEHFGLGRYGDPIDPEACFKCFKAIGRKMKKDGVVYISVPIGKEQVEYNAHRIFYAQTVIDAFQEFDLVEFIAAYGDGKFEKVSDIHKFDNYTNKGGGLFGLFMFKKK